MLSVLKEKGCHNVIATPQLVPGVPRRNHSAQGECTAPLLPIVVQLPDPGGVTASSLSWYPTGGLDCLDVIGS